MAKKPEEIKPGLPAWQGTFGDLMNLLLCFFVLLFSMATMDAQKFEEVAASFSSAFGIFNGGEAALGQGALVGDGISQLNQLSNYIISMGISQNLFVPNSEKFLPFSVPGQYKKHRPLVQVPHLPLYSVECTKTAIVVTSISPAVADELAARNEWLRSQTEARAVYVVTVA